MAGEFKIEVKSNIPKPEDANPTVFTGDKTEMVTVTFDDLTGEVLVEPVGKQPASSTGPASSVTLGNPSRGERIALRN